MSDEDDCRGDYERDRRIDDALTEPWTRIDHSDGTEDLVPAARVRELCEANGDDFHKAALAGSYRTAFASYEARS